MLLADGEDNIWFDGGQVRITTHDGQGNFSIKTGADNDDLKIGNGNGAVKMQLEENGYFYLRNQSGLTNGSTITWDNAFVVDPSSNVGIGNNSPSAKLHVTGNARITTVPAGASRRWRK